jgi:hypothetical protein
MRNKDVGVLKMKSVGKRKIFLLKLETLYHKLPSSKLGKMEIVVG